MGEQRVEADALIKQYRDFLDAASIRTNAKRYAKYFELSGNDLIDGLADDFQMIYALPSNTDWVVETSALPDSPLRNALSFGLARRMKNQSWWEKARLILNLIAQEDADLYLELQQTIRKTDPTSPGEVQYLEKFLATQTRDYQFIIDVANQLGWPDFADHVADMIPKDISAEPVKAEASPDPEEELDPIIVEYNDFLSLVSRPNMDLGQVTTPATGRAADLYISQHFAEIDPFNPMIDWPTMITENCSKGLSNVLYPALYERLQSSSWNTCANFVATVSFRDNPAVKSQLREIIADFARGDVNAFAKFNSVLSTYSSGSRRRNIILVCESIGWNSVAKSLRSKNNSGTSAHNEVREIGTDKHGSPLPDPGKYPCAVALLSPQVGKEIIRQYKFLKDQRLNATTHFLTEEFTTRKRWRIDLGVLINASWRGGSGQVRILDIQITGHHISVDFISPNGLTMAGKYAQVPYLGLSSNPHARDRYEGPLEKLAIISLLYIFGDGRTLYKTQNSKRISRAQKIVGATLSAEDVYYVDYIIDSDILRRLAPSIREYTSATDKPTKSRKAHNVRGHKRRLSSGGHTLVSAYRTGGKKRK